MDYTHLKVEADDSFRPFLPNFARVSATIVQNVGQAVVVRSESILAFIEIARSPTIIVHVPVPKVSLPII